MLEKVQKRIRRHTRIRAKISWTSLRPRLAVFRSNVNIYAQLIDDVAWKTLVSFSDMKISKWNKIEKATKVWEEIAKKAIAAWISSCVFDRGGFVYMWRVKALADAARNNWLQF
jgi:large subunit ribosomal protein L18